MKLRIISIVIILFFSLIQCGTEKPVLKKPITKCTARDLLEYGRALFNAEYYKDAITQYRLVVGNFPKNKVEAAWAQYELAFTYFYIKDYKTALREFKKVIKLYPDIRGPVVLAKKEIDKITILMN